MFIFPQTLSYEYMQNISKTFGDVEHIISFQKEIIGVDPEESADAWSRVESEVIGKRKIMLAAIQDLESKGGMLDLEGGLFHSVRSNMESLTLKYSSFSRTILRYGFEGVCASVTTLRCQRM